MLCDFLLCSQLQVPAGCRERKNHLRGVHACVWGCRRASSAPVAASAALSVLLGSTTFYATTCCSNPHDGAGCHRILGNQFSKTYLRRKQDVSNGSDGWQQGESTDSLPAAFTPADHSFFTIEAEPTCAPTAAHLVTSSILQHQPAAAALQQVSRIPDQEYTGLALACSVGRYYTSPSRMITSCEVTAFEYPVSAIPVLSSKSYFFFNAWALKDKSIFTRMRAFSTPISVPEGKSCLHDKLQAVFKLV